MMLWDLIRDFIVSHITGGYTSDNRVFHGVVGYLVNESTTEQANTTGYGVLMGNIYNDESGAIINGAYMPLGDYLATTLTIISLIFILVACVMFVVKMVKLVGNLVK